jgi:hypothetical protein
MVNSPVMTIRAALHTAFAGADSEECLAAGIKGAMTAQQLVAATGMSMDMVMQALKQAEDIMIYHPHEWATGPAGEQRAGQAAHEHAIAYGLKAHRKEQLGAQPSVQE